MSRECIVDRCGKAALAGLPLCVKHSVTSPQGLRQDLDRAWQTRSNVEHRLHRRDNVLPEEVQAAEFGVRRLEAAVRAYWLVDAGEVAAVPTEAGAAE